jgi:hypothetical protein
MQSFNKREKEWNRSEFWAAFHWPIKEDFTFLWLIQARAGSLLSLASAFTQHSAEFIMSLSRNVNMIYCAAPSASLPRRKPSGKENLLSKQKTSKQMALRQPSSWRKSRARNSFPLFDADFPFIVPRLVLYFFCGVRRWVDLGDKCALEKADKCNQNGTVLVMHLRHSQQRVLWQIDLRHSRWQLICAFPEISEFQIAQMAWLMASFCLCAAPRDSLCIFHPRWQEMKIACRQLPLHKSVPERRDCSKVRAAVALSHSSSLWLL